MSRFPLWAWIVFGIPVLTLLAIDLFFHRGKRGGGKAIFVFLGVAAIEQFEWITYVFAAILLVASWRAFWDDPMKEKENRAIIWLSRHLPVTHEIHGPRFFARINGKPAATPILIALIGLELTDIVFAVDSVPAALAVSHNRFVVYSSNVFAILGLRALYSENKGDGFIFFGRRAGCPFLPRNKNAVGQLTADPTACLISKFPLPSSSPP